jgi:N-formylglutamate amidohydrolase
MSPKIILHIPHSSINIPLKTGYFIDENTIENELIKLTDWYTDDLFYSASDEMVIANFSRLFCDPERFEDDNLEVMAKVGMGVLYTKNDQGETMRKIDPELRENILSQYYRPHHQKLAQAVNHELELHGKALILDCHSYPGKPLVRDLSQNPDRPDFNIGTDAFHTPQALIDYSVEFFKNKGYSLGIDWPYSGSIVPMEHYNNNKNVASIMLEINRDLYLSEPTNEKSGNYENIKKVTGEYLEELKGRFMEVKAN